MSTIDEIMGEAQVFASAWSLVGGRFDDGSGLEHAEECKAALRELIAAALADARRDGAEAMREAAAKLAREAPLHYVTGDPADEELAQAIEDLPPPTGERQAVLLTSAELLLASGRVTQLTFLAERTYRAIEAAALAKNNLEVRRG